MPVFRLIIVDHQAGVDHTGHPAQQRKQKAKNETQDAAGHQHGHWRQSNTKEITKRFQVGDDDLTKEIADSNESIAARNPSTRQRESVSLPHEDKPDCSDVPRPGRNFPHRMYRDDGNDDDHDHGRHSDAEVALRPLA